MRQKIREWLTRNKHSWRFKNKIWTDGTNMDKCSVKYGNKNILEFNKRSEEVHQHS